MRHLLILLALLLPVPVLAQSTATPTSQLAWEQDAPSLAEAQGYRYQAYVDLLPAQAVSSVLCAGSPPAVQCMAMLPAMTAGRHDLQLTASVLIDGQWVEGPHSVPLALQMIAVPAAPRNLHLMSAVQAGGGAKP